MTRAPQPSLHAELRFAQLASGARIAWAASGQGAAHEELEAVVDASGHVRVALLGVSGAGALVPFAHGPQAPIGTHVPWRRRPPRAVMAGIHTTLKEPP